MYSLWYRTNKSLNAVYSYVHVSETFLIFGISPCSLRSLVCHLHTALMSCSVHFYSSEFLSSALLITFLEGPYYFKPVSNLDLHFRLSLTQIYLHTWVIEFVIFGLDWPTSWLPSLWLFKWDQAWAGSFELICSLEPYTEITSPIVWKVSDS